MSRKGEVPVIVDTTLPVYSPGKSVFVCLLKNLSSKNISTFLGQNLIKIRIICKIDCAVPFLESFVKNFEVIVHHLQLRQERKPTLIEPSVLDHACPGSGQVTQPDLRMRGGDRDELGDHLWVLFYKFPSNLPSEAMSQNYNLLLSLMNDVNKLLYFLNDNVIGIIPR